MIYNDSSVKIAGITDGTSNTFLFAEHSKGHLFIIDPTYAISDNAWNSGRWYDTLFATLYPSTSAIGNSPADRQRRLRILRPDGGRELPPRWCELRVLRRFRALHQEFHQLLDFQHRQ